MYLCVNNERKDDEHALILVKLHTMSVTGLLEK